MVSYFLTMVLTTRVDRSVVDYIYPRIAQDVGCRTGRRKFTGCTYLAGDDLLILVARVILS